MCMRSFWAARKRVSRRSTKTRMRAFYATIATYETGVIVLMGLRGT